MICHSDQREESHCPNDAEISLYARKDSVVEKTVFFLAIKIVVCHSAKIASAITNEVFVAIKLAQTGDNRHTYESV
jgi:hypothetical protein